MFFLVDTNILLRSADPSHIMYPDALKATGILHSQGEQLCIIPQNLIEFWNVYTRPRDKNGLGHTIKEAEAEVNRLKGLFALLADVATIYSEWERLVIKYDVKGVKVHDARLVAAMVELSVPSGKYSKRQEAGGKSPIKKGFSQFNLS